MSSATHELGFATHPAGGQQEARHRLRDERSRRPDALLGAWATETGILNRVVSLWALDAGTRDVGTEGEDDWLSGHEVRRRLVLRRAIDSAALASPLLELRRYSPQPGQREAFVAALLGVLPSRERYSPCAGVWVSHERGRDVVVHVWGYRSFDERVAARTQAAADPAWDAYRKSMRPLLASMHATLLLPFAP